VYREWDGETPLYSNLLNKYFFSADELTDYCYDEELDIKTLRLIICKPNKYAEIDYDYWEDILDNDDQEIPKELQDAVNVLNSLIRTLPPASWSPSDIRTSYDDTPVGDQYPL